MNDEETTSISTYVSLCSGYDGIGIGLKRAIPNLRTIAHCEIEAYAVANLIAKMEAGLLDACPIFTDLKTFPYRELRDKVTILSAGFPCQPFSSAGKRKATEDPRHLYPFIADGVTAMRPRYVLLENVEGIISAKTGDGESVLKYVLGDLEQRGYSCTWGVFSASEVGAPHQRKRVFILGYSKGIGFKETTPVNEWREYQPYNGNEIRNLFGTTSDPTLGNTSSERSCGGCEDSDRIKSEMLGSGLGKTRYPARPGEEQYDWEEPRVISDSKCIRLECTRDEGSLAEESGQTRKEGSQSSQTSKDISSSSSSGRGEGKSLETNRQTKSCVGGTANGASHRVDRLRLLGNGVVPDTCELAFKTLIQQL